MKLQGLLGQLEYKILQGNVDINIKNIQYDSRKVTEGSLFICVKGFQTDGHHYAQNAVKKGAIALLVQDELSQIDADVTVIKLNNTRQAMAYLADKYYAYPSKNFKLIGVTGTNGKTTTTYLIKSILDKIGKKTGLIGTNGNKIGNTVLPASRTTPEALELQKLFYDMSNENVSHVIMEVSSHALDLYRVDRARFDVGVFTNLSLDHLDYHKTMENYLNAKIKLFTLCKIGVINIDDENSQTILDKATCKKLLTYGIENDKADFNAIDIHMDLNGSTFDLKYNGIDYFIHLATPGRFSVYNALASIGAACALNIPINKIIEGLESNKGVEGRFQTFASKKGYTAIVDYAHAPDGLLNVLKSINDFAKGKVITVFGCGGDRDKSKRPVMGKIAGQNSDYCVITSDNPRTEEPNSIIDQIEIGIQETNCRYTKITDRKVGIEYGLSLARKNDIILIAGKGHEDYQIIGTEKTHFDDSEVVLEYFNNN